MIVDFHAELTSEKVAMGWHLDGRVAAVLGTHTHVPTADARVLPGGTAHITDVGMTGSRSGVIGVKREQALQAFRTQMPVRFESATEDVWVMGARSRSATTGWRARSTQVIVPAGEGPESVAAGSPAPAARPAGTAGTRGCRGRTSARR